LICDLSDPAGPRSREIYTAEAVADDVSRASIDLTRVERSIELPEAGLHSA
jgi:hypothetical protein